MDSQISQKLDNIVEKVNEAVVSMARLEEKINHFQNQNNKNSKDIKDLKDDVSFLKHTNKILRWTLGLVSTIATATAVAAIKFFMGW